MSDHKLEDQFKEKLDGYVSPIDADALWNDMHKKDKKRFPLWWIFGSLALLLTVGIIYINSQDNYLAKKTNPSTAETTTIINKEKKQKNINSVKELKDTSFENDRLRETNEIVEDKINSEKISTKTNEIDRIEAANNQIKKQTAKINNQKVVLNQNNISSTILLKSKDTPFKNQSNKIEISKPKSSNESIVEIEYSEDKNTQIKANPQKQKQISTSNTNDTNDLIKLEELKFALLAYSIEEPVSKDDWTKKISTKNNSIPKFGLGAYYSYEYASRSIEQLDSINTSLELNYAEVRNASESFVESYRTGLFLRKKLKAGFRISTGIEYAKLTERFDAAIDLGVRLDSLNSSVQPTYIKETNIKKIYNKYETINLPILIGKEFSKNKWVFYIDAGVAFNLRSQNKGQVFSDAEAFEVSAFNKDNSSIFKDKLSLSYLASAGVSYRLNQNLSLELGPNWQSTFKSMNAEEHFLSTKHHYFGLKLGVIKEFR